VHEKLVGFMAPNSSAISWPADKIDSLFASIANQTNL